MWLRSLKLHGMRVWGFRGPWARGELELGRGYWERPAGVPSLADSVYLFV